MAAILDFRYNIVHITYFHPHSPVGAHCGLRGCKNRAHFVYWPDVAKGIPNQGVDCSVSKDSFSVSLLFRFVSLFLVVSTSAKSDCLETLGLRNCMSSGMLNPTHSLTH